MSNINSGYGLLRVLFDVSLVADRGEIVAILGPNGAGKTTLLRTIIGLTNIYSGTISLENMDITKLPPYERVRLGISLVPEGRQLFPHMSVLENLLMGGFLIENSSDLRERLEFVFSLFPVLKQRLYQKAMTLSGGEQQMLAIARALMGRPKVLMLDEPSQGLAPKIVLELFRVLDHLRSEKSERLAIILVEQYARDALEIADRVYVLRGGRVVLEARSSEIKSREDLIKYYLT